MLIAMKDESEAFWCFAALMEKLKANFYEDGSGIQTQFKTLRKLIEILDPPLYSHLAQLDSLHLFCSFRWILVLFRREFSFDDSQRLWDVLFTNYYTVHMHLFVCVAIFEHHRNDIMANVNTQDDLLKYAHNLALAMDLDQVTLVVNCIRY